MDVLFGNISLEGTFTGVEFVRYDLTMPEPVLNVREVPGRDGILDYTESMGWTRYKMRTLTVNAIYRKSQPYMHDLSTIASWMSGELHGKVFQITLPDRSGVTIRGRVTVDFSMQGRFMDIWITALCYPYFEAKTEWSNTKTQSGSGTTPVTRSHTVDFPYTRPLVPSITVTNPATIQQGNSSYSVPAGTHLLPNIVLKKGFNYITVITIPGTLITFRGAGGAF